MATLHGSCLCGGIRFEIRSAQGVVANGVLAPREPT